MNCFAVSPAGRRIELRFREPAHCAWGGASLIKSAQARVPLLVAAGAIEPGTVIEASHLRVVEASLSGGIAYLPASMQDTIVGRAAPEERGGVLVTLRLQLEEAGALARIRAFSERTRERLE